MKPSKQTRRAFNVAALAGVASLTGVAGITGLQAQQKTIKVGITLPLTGADAEDALLIKNGAMLAIDEANAKGGVAGYKIEVVTYDSGTATAGQ
jgi:branched-chain amino acid transport system substrate-binding protein